MFIPPHYSEQHREPCIDAAEDGVDGVVGSFYAEVEGGAVGDQVFYVSTEERAHTGIVQVLS